MLGRDLRILLDSHQVFSFDIADLDITQTDRIKEKLVELGAEVVVNCAAVTDVDGCEQELKQLALEVNGFAVGRLGELCAGMEIPLVHISTDYVFYGDTDIGYTEDDQPNPVNYYGYTKFVGEQLLLGKEIEGYQPNIRDGKLYIARVCWTYGEHGKNFVHTMLNLAQTAKELRVVNDQFGKPSWTMDVSKQLKLLIETMPQPGVYHIANEGIVSRFEEAQEIMRFKGIDIDVVPCDSNQMQKPAKRPYNTALINTKLPPMRHWKEALQDYLASVD